MGGNRLYTLFAAKTAFSFRKECGKNRTRTFLCKRRRSGNNSRADAAVLEPYTSALPDLDTLRQDIREKRVLAAREGEKLLGFLRFGREKKVSVLWQIAVAPDGRGKGIGSGLVQDWLVIERDEAAKFQLWVREDNPSALRMYEASGFLPDGRIAPVMMKK